MIWQAMVRAGVPVALAWMIVTAAFFLPLIDSTRVPYFDLTGWVAEVSYWISLSASSRVAPVVGIVLLLILVTRKDIGNPERWKEAGAAFVVVAIFAGGGAALNENVLKERLMVPRPNIVWLAGVDGAGPLGMTPQEFYESGGKAARSDVLKGVLNQNPAPVSLSTRIESHWVAETGFSFPSGHSFAAFLFATFFLFTAVSVLSSKRLWLFCLLLPWAVAVCYSRSILRVHTPADIATGALQGIVLGMVSWLVVRVSMRRLARSTS